MIPSSFSRYRGRHWRHLIALHAAVFKALSDVIVSPSGRIFELQSSVGQEECGGIVHFNYKVFIHSVFHEFMFRMYIVQGSGHGSGVVIKCTRIPDPKKLTRKHHPKQVLIKVTCMKQ